MKQGIIRYFKKVGIDLTIKNPLENYFILIGFILILTVFHELGHAIFAYLFNIKFSFDINLIPQVILDKNFSPLNQKFEYIVMSTGGMLFSLVTYPLFKKIGFFFKYQKYWFILAVILLGLIDVFHVILVVLP